MIRECLLSDDSSTAPRFSEAPGELPIPRSDQWLVILTPRGDGTGSIEVRTARPADGQLVGLIIDSAVSIADLPINWPYDSVRRALRYSRLGKEAGHRPSWMGER